MFNNEPRSNKFRYSGKERKKEGKEEGEGEIYTGEKKER